MLLQQLKVLLWRNAVLKKRGIISTLIEIAIPGLIIFIIGKYLGLYNIFFIFLITFQIVVNNLIIIIIIINILINIFFFFFFFFLIFGLL